MSTAYLKLSSTVGTATGLAQHVRRAAKPSLASAAARSTMRAKPAVVNGGPRSLVNTNGDLGFPLQLAQGPHFIADNRMGSRRALLGPAHVQDGVGEIDLIPTQVYKLGRPQTMAEGDKDHGGRHPCDPSDRLLGQRRVVGGRARSRRSDRIRCG